MARPLDGGVNLLAPHLDFDFGVNENSFTYDAWGGTGHGTRANSFAHSAPPASPAPDANSDWNPSSLAIPAETGALSALLAIAKPPAADHDKFTGLAEALARFELRSGELLETVTTHSFAFQQLGGDQAKGSAGNTRTHGTADEQPTAPSEGTADLAATGLTVALTGDAVSDSMPARLAADGSSSLLTSLAQSSVAPTVFEKRVAAAGDDVEQRASGGMSSNVSDLDLGVDGTTQQIVGLRFTNIDVPQGAIITSAYIQFQADETSNGTASLLIRGEDTDDAAPFTTVKFNVSSRPTTNMSTTWSPANWTNGAAQQTADLTAIVQEIVDRLGWAALNDMVFLITGTGTRTAESFEGNPGAASLLHIEYLPPGPVSDPVVFNNPPDSNANPDQIAELVGAGTAVGISASATDPDPGSTVTYSIDDARFAIDPDTGVITRSSTGTLDFETESSIVLSVTATSSDHSTAVQTFSLAVLNSPEQVAFNTPADTDPANNKISQSAAAGTTVGITASATDPDTGSTVTYSINDSRFAINPNTGVITRSGTGTLNAQTEPTANLTVTATSSDGSFDTETFSVGVTNNTLPTSLTLVRTTLTSLWSTPSPDPSGIAYISHLGTLFVSDGEVDEISTLFTGKSVFQMSLSGTLVSTFNVLDFTDEPSGVAYNPTNRHLFFADDTGTKRVYELNPGQDGLYRTSDDIVTSFRTSGFGSSDPEGISYDPNRGVLYVADGVSNKIHTVAAGANGIFDGTPSVGGDDVVTSFATGSLGVNDPEAVEYDPVHDLLYIIASRTAIAMVTTTGQLLGMLNISAANTRKPAGLALAPSSADPSQTSLYLADRGQDNDSHPNENDGKIFEFRLNDWALV